jgi:RHS repeat-associated protein
LTLFAASAAALVSTSAAATPTLAALPEIEVKHMPEIEEWVYRNGAVKSPVSCATVCTSLWNSEHSSLPELASTQEMWDKIGSLETEKTGLWATMAEFGTELEGAWAIGPTPFLVGWHIGSGEGSKWMRIVGPTAPLTPPPACGNWDIIFKTLGQQIARTFHQHAYAPGNEWYLDVCGSTEMVGQVAAAENPGAPNSNCGDNGFGVDGGWTEQKWWWNECFEGYNNGQEVLAPVTAQAYYKPFHFGRPEEWSGQKTEGEFAHNIQTAHPQDPGPTVVREATERVLEEPGWLPPWIQWVLEGEHGANPLRTSPEEEYGAGDESAPTKPKCMTPKPVNCATGNEVASQNDLRVGGRGPGLTLTRTYNSQLAAKQTAPGPLGYGWTGSYAAYVETSEEGRLATVHQDSGATTRFLRSGEQWVAANPLIQAKLAAEGTNYLDTLPDQTVLHFNSAGQLTSEVDRNGNALTMSRNGEGRLESVTDPAGRKLTLTYDTDGLIETAKDPMGHEAKYGYEGGKLASVTEPGESSSRWQFKYDASHRLTTMTDGRGGKTTTEYDGANRVIAQTDPMERTLSFEYEPSRTKITNKATGAVTDEHFSIDNEPSSVTHGYGTASATTDEFTYDQAGNLASRTDGNKHTTTYVDDAEGNRTSLVDADEHETKWTYDSKHDVISSTTPKGETTTIKRDSHGNAETIERPAPGGTTQTTKYGYDLNGSLTSVEDPLKRVWKYEYNSHGDRTAEIDPEGDKRTWADDEDSHATSSVSPRGNAEGAEASKYTTKTERDAQERPLKIADALGHETKYAYDANGNLESITDPNGHKTKYTYDANDEQTKVEEPSGTTTETGYDGAGKVASQTDGNKHNTKYVRNILEQATEVIDPLSRNTTKEYDKAGNLAKVTDPAKRITTNVYDPGNILKETTFSDGKTHAIQYEYDADQDRTKLIDGTGTTTLTYDQLDRLTESKDGHGDVAKYEYDLANQQTKITYPNGKAVVRGYDKAGRLEKVTDWLEHTTTFAYDPDSALISSTFPTGTSNVDKYAYNEADQMSEVQMTKGAESLASLVYTRDNDGQLKTTTSKGLPGEEKPAYEYDPNNRLAKAGTSAYEYDYADNPTKIPGSTNTYDNASELKTGTSLTYGYDGLGERTKRTPTTGAATSYGYDETGNLTSVERPKEGKTAGITDAYTYDGNGLRTSQTISATASYFTWNMTTRLPLILNDGTNSYIYGPGDLPVEQISGGGTVLYLHHDQQGSTRMLTSPTGAKEATFSYDAYGNTTGTTGTAKAPLGYISQYTSSDSGLIYLRARVYDPSTAQFMSVDPLEKLTGAPYGYAEDNPVNESDPTGEGIFGPIGKILFPGGGSGQACVGGSVSIGAVTLGGEVCYVHTPHGEGIAVTPSVTVGPGVGVNIHAGAGESNACRPSEYGGPFSQASGSASGGLTGGYYSRFSSWPFSGVTGGRRVEGWTAGGAVGLNAEAGVGGSYTFTIPIGSEGGGSGSSGCGCS